MKDYNLICTKCYKKFPVDSIYYRCDICGEPLELEEIKQGKINKGNILNQTILERYLDFYPFLDIDSNISLGEGFTGLVKSGKLADVLGIKKIYFKNESQNPTWSFKDRGTVSGVQHAIKLGYKRIGTVSTGNMATSIAAYGAKANLETFVFVRENIPYEKLKPIAIYNPNLIKVDGDYEELYFESLKIGKENNIYFINSDAPIRIEGYKTASFEVCEQLNFDIPDYVMVPISAGGNIRGIEKGFREFKNSGLISKTPKIIGVQALGCSPVYNAFKNQSERVLRFKDPNTVAHAIGNPTPPSGNQVIRMIKANGGNIVAVSDEEIIAAQAMMATTGIFGQLASVTSLAAVKKLKDVGYLKSDDKIVCIVTASGLKHTAALETHDLKVGKSNINELSRLICDKY